MKNFYYIVIAFGQIMGALLLIVCIWAAVIGFVYFLIQLPMYWLFGFILIIVFASILSTEYARVKREREGK